MKSFLLKISSPEGDIFNGEVTKISVRGTEGELAVNITTTLAIGTCAPQAHKSRTGVAHVVYYVVLALADCRVAEGSTFRDSLVVVSVLHILKAVYKNHIGPSGTVVIGIT